MSEKAFSTSSVVAWPMADPVSAHAHFVRRLSVETDADDVASTLAAGLRDFHLVEARNPAATLAALGRSVKEMLGGFEYWVREGHPVEGHDAGSGRYAPDPSGLTTLPRDATCGCAAPSMHEPPRTG